MEYKFVLADGAYQVKEIMKNDSQDSQALQNRRITMIEPGEISPGRRIDVAQRIRPHHTIHCDTCARQILVGKLAQCSQCTARFQ
jgi:hypothetical protein